MASRVRRGLVATLCLAAVDLAAGRLGDPSASAPEVEGNASDTHNVSIHSAAAMREPSAVAVDAVAQLVASWGNGTALDKMQPLTNRMVSNSKSTMGYAWRASTTRYGDSDAASCGGLNTAKLIAGTDYHSVASSQAMQSLFKWGASCCYCGEAAPHASSQGVAPMGCFTCAKGRFLNERPYEDGNNDGFATAEIRIVVSDVCPGDAGGWCQAKPGDKNLVGERNHFDFSWPPSGINNNFFVFTPEECSPELKLRMAGGEGRCHQ
mmetsp:Transcript_53536/g.174239  ORF Transcript_53536/g.174239 Transcript_53536/m.174239 type:complete len:265 (-) Transcript_53536:190-984(-)